MNLKYSVLMAAFAVSAVMAQNEAPAAETPASAPQPIAQVAPAEPQPVAEQVAPAESTTSNDKFTSVEQEQAPENLFAEPSAVRGADATKPVVKKTTKKFVYRPVYSPEEIETSGGSVKMIYVSESAGSDTLDMDKLRGLVPLKFTFGIQSFVGNEFLSGDNGRYAYDRYSGLTWNVGAFALLPLDEYNMAFKAGVLFEHDKVSNTFNDVFNEKYAEYHVSFSQYRISVPLLLSLKSARSSLFFDVGVQPSFAVSDEFKLKSSEMNHKEDMLDNDYRSSVDWSIIIGFGIRANRYIGFDARFSWGLSNQYDDYAFWPINNLSSKTISVGATFYAL